MAKGITNKFDVERDAVTLDKGFDPLDNEGICPHESKIPETPGETASNTTMADSWDKGPPWEDETPNGMGRAKRK